MARQAKTTDKAHQIKLIHTLKGALGFDDDTYRALLAEYGVASSKDLRPAQLTLLVRDLKTKAVAAGVWKRRASTWKPAQGKQSLMAKIEALLAESGRGLEYADGMAQHMFKLQSVRWCDADQLRRIVAALTYDQRRRTNRHNKANREVP